MQFGLAYDLRNPAISQRSTDTLYQEFLDQVRWADSRGFASVSMPEHHGVDDGYIPSPVPMAAAVASNTEHMRIRFYLLLLPLYHPVRLAEDLAVVDLLSKGRIEVYVGSGYRPEEYVGLGLPMRDRGRRMDEGIEILKLCWTEDTFDYDGKYWQLKDVRVIPKPVQKPRPKIILGGASPASARRAARIGDGYAPITDRLFKFYHEEQEAMGITPTPVPRIPEDARPPKTFLHVSRDPDRAWKTIGPHAMHVVNSYAEFAGGLKYGPYQAVSDPDDLLADGSHAVMTPEQVVELGKKMEAADPAGATLRFSPLLGGMPADVGQECLDLLVNEVMPHFATT